MCDPSGVWSTSWVSPSVYSWIVCTGHTCTPWGGVLGLVPAPPPIPLDQPPPSGGAGGGIYGKIKMNWVNDSYHNFLFAAGSLGFDIVGSDSVLEDNELISVCLRFLLNTNAPGQFAVVAVTSADGTALRGKYS